MRFSIVATVAALSATALAQGGLPDCARTCFGNNLGNCGIADVACICSNEANLGKVACCVYSTCSPADQETTIKFAVSLCKNNGVNINTACVSGSASATSTSPASHLASGSASASASSDVLASVSGASRVSGTASGSSTASGSRTSAASESTARSTGAAPAPSAEAGYSLGMVLAGMLAAAL